MASPSPPPPHYRGTNNYDDDEDEYYIAKINQILVNNPKASLMLNKLLEEGRKEGRFNNTDEFNNLVEIAKKPNATTGILTWRQE